MRTLPLKFVDGCLLVGCLALIALVGCTPTGGPGSALAVEKEEEPATDQPAAEDAPSEPPKEEPAEEPDPEHPFPTHIPAPDFPKGMTWLNTAKPIHKDDLKGKFVILDFWTYCCINCIHILPELKKLEHAYPNNLVVIGVHSAKFDTEKGSDNIAEAILRYEIEHPVVNDKDHRIWNLFGVNSWPSIVLIDPEGNFVGRASGEFKYETLDRVFKDILPYYRKKGLLDETPIRFERLQYTAKKTPLQFPGKVLADEASGRLFIADSNHNRIVISDLDGKLIETIGSGLIGEADGGYAQASFDHPQGMALHGDTLYICDTENHLLRKIDLKTKKVTTIAGIGSQAKSPWPGLDRLAPGDALPKRFVGPPKTTALNSPWALQIHGDKLYIAMAGPHQLWMMPLDESEIGPYAGNGREDIVDGALMPQEPYQAQQFRLGKDPIYYSSFAQPSGLTSDGEWIYVADSEGSSIRAVPYDTTKQVRTVVGTNLKEYGRLFEFGFADGPRDEARLQHALGVAYHDGVIYTADTYNNAIRAVDAETGAVTTLAGVRAKNEETNEDYGVPGDSDEEGSFDEPAGLSYAAGKLYIADTNNHVIRVLDLKTKKVSTLLISGLKAPTPVAAKKKPNFAKGKQITVDPVTLRAEEGMVTLKVNLELPDGWKINEFAPMKYYPDSPAETGPVDRTAIGEYRRVEKPVSEFTFTLPVAGEGKDTITVGMNYYYCQKDDGGLCKIGTVFWTIPLTISADAKETTGELTHKISP